MLVNNLVNGCATFRGGLHNLFVLLRLSVYFVFLFWLASFTLAGDDVLKVSSVSSNGGGIFLTLENLSDRVVVIQDIFTDCSCHKTKFERKVIFPNHRIKVFLRVKPEGPFPEEALVSTTDAIQPVIRLSLKQTDIDGGNDR